MVNKIEIVVSGRNEMPATFAEVKAQAGAFGQAVGADAGEKLAASLGDKVKQELPPKLEDPMKETGASSGAAFSRSFTDRAAQDLGSPGVLGDMLAHSGAPEGEKFAASFSHSAQDALMRSSIGTAAGADFSDEYVQRVRSKIPPALAPDGEIGAPMVENAKKTGDKVGKDAGAAAAQGMSPLIIAAIGGAAAVGAPLLLAALGPAFVGVAAFALKSNVVIADDYKRLAKDAGSALTEATAPLAGTLHQSVVSLDGSLKSLQPQLDTLFSNAGPDITSFEGGVASLVSNMLPGMSSALGSSQVIVKDFSDSMGPLGSGVGSFFTGLTRDASTTGAGLQSVFGVLSNTVSTLGSVLGSASSGISADLLGIDPVINGLLTGVRALANPATVGGLAGVFGAMKLDPGISSGLDGASKGLKSFAKDAETSSGLMGTMKSAAGGLSGALGTAAGVMNGPWGLAVGAGVGLLSGLAGMLYESAHASDALTLSQQGLADAVARDGGTAGQATVAYVAQTAAADGLQKSAAQAGVSLTTWTQAVIGNKAAQDEVTASVMTSNQVVQNQKLVTDEAAKSTGKFSDEQKDAQTAAQGASAANNRLTDQNKQLLASMQAQNQQIADAITKQSQLTAATNALNSSRAIFNATLASGYQTLVANSQATAMNTVAALDLGDGSYSLNQQIYDSVNAYDQAQTEGNAYLQVLTSMSGTINTLLGTEAAFTTSLSNLDKQIDKSGASLDVNTAAGAKNITTLTQAATAATKAAGAVYDNEVATQGATKAFNDANAKLEQEKQAFIAAADKAGMNKDAVKQLADQLFQLPSNVQVGVGLDTGPATYGLSQLLKRINTSSGTVTVYENTSGVVGSTLGGNKAYASGGAVSFAAAGGAQGGFTWMNEQGPELVRLPTGAQVMTAASTAAMLSHGGGGHASGGGAMQVEFGGDTDGAFATAFMMLVRQGKIQIKQKAIVR